MGYKSKFTTPAENAVKLSQVFDRITKKGKGQFMSGEGGEEQQMPAERLTRIEEHQIFKAERLAGRDTLQTLSREIAAVPSLREQLISNPYSSESLHTLGERFPESSTSDAIRAVIIAEPEGPYDRKFEKLPKKQQRGELYRQIDSSAEMTMKLARYFNEHAQEFWELPEEQIYERLTNAAFGTSELGEVEAKYAQNQRRGFRLSVVNFIEDLKNLKPYKEEFAVDARAKAGNILGREFEGNVEVESLPVGFIVYLDEVDYGKIERVEESQELTTAGVTLFWSSLPPELKGRLVIINKGGEKIGIKSSKDIKDTKNHELRHILFANFLAEREPLYTKNTEKRLGELSSIEDHKLYADQLRKSFLSVAKDEVIAYYCSGDSEEIKYRRLSNLGGDKWLGHLEKVSDSLWLEDDIIPEEKRSIYDSYQDQFATYLGQIREYQWIAQKLLKDAQDQEGDFFVKVFRERLRAIKDGPEITREEAIRRLQNQGIEPGLTIEKAEALLQNTPIDKARRLGRYFGVNPEDIAKKLQDEQQQNVKEFSKAVDELTGSQIGRETSKEENVSWIEKIGWDAMDKIKLTYPAEATPALLKVIEAANDQFLVEDSIYAVELILQMNQKIFSSQELTTIKASLENMLSQRTNNDFGSARAKAVKLVRKIDDLNMYGGTDFVHNEPFGTEVARIMKTAEGQQPTIEQVGKLVKTLEGKDKEMWWKYFRVDYFDAFKEADAIPVLIEIGNVATNPYYVGVALEHLESLTDDLSPESKGQALRMINDVLTKNYEDNPEILDKLREDAANLRDKFSDKKLNVEA